jgi:hypothetical protein
VAIKPYSFRFPYDIESTLAPLRPVSGTLTSGNDGLYDQIIATLRDRDRAIEDYLSLGVSQGRLAYVISTSNQAVASGAAVDITGLTVSVSLPANRVIRVTGQCIFAITPPMTLDGFINQDGTNVAAFGENSNATGGDATNKSILQCGSAILTPTAGDHTYKLQAQATGAGSATIGASAAAPGFILVEDIGPASR